MSQPHEPGQPEVELRLGPDGLHVTLRVLLRGDGSDWHADIASAWLLSFWERLLVTAEMVHTFGLAGLPLPVSVLEAAPAAAVEAPAAPESLDARIERAERLGTIVAPVAGNRRLSPAASAELGRRLVAAVQAAEPLGLTRPELDAALKGYTELSITWRLNALSRKGQLVFHAAGAKSRGTWHLSDARPPDPILARVLPHTREKIFLMLGGNSKAYARKATEAALSLQELRWPEYRPDDGPELGLRELAKADVDLILINRFNKRYSSQFAPAARALGKPVVILQKGYGVAQIIDALLTQWIEGEKGNGDR